MFEVERFSFALDSAEQANLAELEGEARTADVADLAGRLAAPFTTVVDSARGALDRCRSELDEAFAAL
ncbi:MAG: hypothetical protein GWN85_12025, partial [Gemmatimonadetes bacterium]|nr:hypothetical protein [Gemmatimonadota bacterium]